MVTPRPALAVVAPSPSPRPSPLAGAPLVSARLARRPVGWLALALSTALVTSCAGSGRQGAPQPVALKRASPTDYHSWTGCALYAQARRPDLGPTGGAGGAADYLTKFRDRRMQVSRGVDDLRNAIAVGYAVVWDRMHSWINGNGSGHVAIVEQVARDYIVVSQAGVGPETRETVYRAASMRMRINRADLHDLFLIP